MSVTGTALLVGDVELAAAGGLADVDPIGGFKAGAAVARGLRTNVSISTGR